MPRSAHRLSLVVLAAAAAALLPTLAAQESRAPADRLAALRDAAADRDPARTESRFAELSAAGASEDALDEARLLVGKTRLLHGRAAEAADAVRPVVERDASPWHVKALFLTAEAAARRRDFATAAEIFERRIEAAASDAHAAELGRLYREIADLAFEGATVRDEFGRERRVPDWGAARVFYERARAHHLPAADRAEVAHRIARSALEAGDAAAAAVEWTALLEGRRDTAAGDRADDALYGLGQAHLRLGRAAEARAAWRRLREEHGDSELAPLALVRTGESWLAAPSAGEEGLARALAAWREFLALHPDHAEAPATAWRIGESLERAGKAREAAAAFREFLERFPKDERAPAAQDRVAHAHLALGEYDAAVREWRVLLDRWPDHPLWAQAQRNVSEAAFREGEAALEEDRLPEARAALEAFLAASPVAPRAPQAQRLLGEIARREGRHGDAVEAWRLVTRKYAESPVAPQAALDIAAAHEGPLADVPRALEVYEELIERWPRAPEAARAREVLAELRAKRLEARVQRPFRTDEEPAVELRLRNVPSLRMKAYRLRPDEYLRRRGGLAGVEQVEVDVVRPDFEWDLAVPEHVPYRLLERRVALPFDRPGAYAVTASEEDLTATFLVVVSDLTTIVKAAPGQALVFVWDERTGLPVEGAQVELLDGGARGLTAVDGVWRRDDVGVARVRAVVTGRGDHSGHFAFADGSAPGTAAFGYTAKVFLETDRPLYRPGQRVHVRGTARRVENGSYVAQAGLDVPLRVTDPRGAVLLDAKVPADEYGVLATELELAHDPPLGTYTVAAELDGRTFTRTFDVLAYRRPEVFVEVTPARAAFLVGDPLEATVELRYAVGGAVAGAAVRWVAYSGPFEFDPKLHEGFGWFFRDAARDEELRRRAEQGTEVYTRGEGLADAEGRLAISFPTAVVEEDRTYTIVVEAQDPNRRWVRSASSVPVTRRDAYVMGRTERKVYRPGEAIRLEVTTVGPLHSPVALEGRAVLVRRRLSGEHFVEDEVASAPATTGADGRAVVELRAERPGEHLVRFEARDSRGNPVSGGATVTVAGAAEDLARQARLVADREFYREGDVARVLVNVPVAPAPVLLTWEGERILGHRVVRATERSNTIEMPLTAEHAPNVFLRMAVARGGELFEDGDEVAVFQFLGVEVEAVPAEARPGGRVRIGVRTTDSSGRPVRAAVGVQVVDSAVLELAPDATPQIEPFFYDQRRTHGVATASSSGTPLPSVTEPTNPDLLFERMRRLGKEQWERMQQHVDLGKKLLEQGDLERARSELSLALEIAPGNYEARALVARIAALKEAASVASKAGAPPAASPAPQPDSPVQEGGVAGGYGGRRGGVARRTARGGGAQSDDKDLLDAPVEESERQESSDRSPRVGDARLLDLEANGYLEGAVLLLQDQAPMIPAELRRRFADTALSAPRVRTDESGSATVELELPDNLTTWKVTARGASTGALVGEGGTSFRAAKRLVVRADAPRFLVEGDATTATGTVHSGLEQQVEVRVRFAPEGVSGDGRETTLTLDPGGVQPVDHGLAATRHGLATLRVEALTSVESDAALEAFPVLPRGLRRLDGASGTLEEEAFVELELPERRVAGTASITISLSPSLDATLLESLAYTGGYPYGCVEQTVNRFLPAVAARASLESLGSAGEGGRALREHLDEVVRRSLSALYALQNDDGSFGWFGVRSAGGAQRGAGDPEMTAYALLGMLRAEAAGHPVSTPNRDRAVAAAQTLVRGAGLEDRAFLLYALAHANRADLADLTALARERTALAPRGLALLALAMQRTGRPGNAAEAVRLLERMVVEDAGAAWWGPRETDARRRVAPPFAFRDAEPTGYALLALLVGDPSNRLVDPAARWLLASRRGPAWQSTRDTAVAIEALSAYARHASVRRAEGEVEVFLAGAADPVRTIRFGGGGRPVDAPVAVELPADALVSGTNRIVLRRRGTGRVHYTALASAVEPSADGSPLPPGGRLVEVERDYTEWAPPPLAGERPGQRLVPGWSVVVPERRPADWHGRRLDRAGTGDKVRVTLRVAADAALERVIVEDPLPAGFEVVRGSAEGPYDREERRDDRQVFFLSRLEGSATVTYVLQAVHPGTYAALPASARAMYEPELHGWSREDRLVVTPEPGTAGRAPSAEEITPDELFALALRASEAGDPAGARQGLEDLMARFELVPAVLEEAWARLFRAGVALGDAQLTVRAHEQLTDRNPRRAATSLEDRRALARAYRDVGEEERALTILRDLARELFALDAAAAQAFAETGDPWRARELLTEALRRQPDAPWVEEQELALARGALELRAPAEGQDRRLPEAGAPRPLLLDEAVARLRSFQAHHAGSRLAHEAGHLAVRTLLAMGLSGEAIAEGTRFLGRFPESPHLDDVTYLVAEGHFQADDHERALAAARPLYEREYPRDDDPSRTAPSPYRAQAIHLAAKIAHLRGDLARAVDLYRQVEGLFPDARDAREFLTRPELSLAEVVTCGVGEEPRLDLRRRNVPEVRLKVYAVDFMILYALRRELSAMNRIDLSGVEPVKEWTLSRGGTEAFRWSAEGVPLAVRDKGVYLVTAHAPDAGLEASSVVLVSDLELAVQPTGGRLRVYATDRRTGAPRGDVYVKVGDGARILAQGFTDARGVYETALPESAFSVVAERDGHVALWRR